MLAAAGTYIPGAGATSSAAELVDPAGTYSSAGASAPMTDAPGSYTLAGVSAPTLVQPGYYVPTAGASSETPVSPSYYQPYAGATAEFLAQAPVISGTVAGQTTASGQTDTPFASVTITDPNIDTSDSLSIQLTGMNSQELETATRLKLNLVVLVLEDNAYGMIRWKQATDGFPDFGMTFGDPDFVAYARAYGAKGARVETADGLTPTLEAASAGGGVHLVTAPVDYLENKRVLVDELRANASTDVASVP